MRRRGCVAGRDAIKDAMLGCRVKAKATQLEIFLGDCSEMRADIDGSREGSVRGRITGFWVILAGTRGRRRNDLQPVAPEPRHP